jgi:putative DNA primase/helicase
MTTLDPEVVAELARIKQQRKAREDRAKGAPGPMSNVEGPQDTKPETKPESLKWLDMSKALSPEFSEDYLALGFTNRFKVSLRYVAALGKWFVWDGARWRIDETQLARDQVRAICREFSSLCNEPRQAKLIASANTVSAVERLASTDRRIAATIGQFDSDPWLLNTPGGTIDLRTGERRKHAPDDYITKITGAASDSTLPTPVWNNFLSRVTADNADLIAFLRRVAGYSLTGSTQEHALFFLYGLGANGKSTFLNAITAAAGDCKFLSANDKTKCGCTKYGPRHLTAI